jgi:polysaccharide deacetylase family protein (PEP-CTERM system associated)
MAAHALTVDLEDWRQVIHRRMTGMPITPCTSVIDQTLRLLDMLDVADVRATFFVVGAVAQSFPGLVREVDRRGHEIGSHSHLHEMPTSMQRDAFKIDVARSVARLQDITGKSVLGFRAPEFAVGSLDHWTFEVLAELGFLYDSSVFPLKGLRYGIAGAPKTPFTIDTASGPIREYPMATWKWGNVDLPVAGGGYFRLTPAALVRAALKGMDRAGRTGVFYVHPYEFHRGALTPRDATWRGPLRLKTLPFAFSRIALHNFNSGGAEAVLAQMLFDFEFRPLQDIFFDEQAAGAVSGADPTDRWTGRILEEAQTA